MKQLTLPFRTPGRGFTDISDALAEVVSEARVETGLCHIFLMHTSASLIVQENADPDVLRDLEEWMLRHIPDGDAYHHSAEGPDDMPAHIRAALTATSLTLPVQHGKLALGTWQAVYLYEHRHHPHLRQVLVTVMG
ncbi:MAG: secondary thiamine-phosphate synthase enzyme YjbQ [Myxococcota bacterium]|nr:secondary thiamine-phosphate synthase enzyme YjbQ [Myxococcota bacterium]